MAGLSEAGPSAGDPSEAGTSAEQVLITEVLLRDGFQIEPAVISTPDKLRLARGLIDAGLTSLEAGSFVSAAAVPQMADTAEVLAGLRGVPASLHTLVFTPRGAKRAVDAGARHVRLVLSASDGHSQANAGAPTGVALDRLASAAAILRDAGITVEATIATAFVCPYDGVTDPGRVAWLAGALHGEGAAVIHLADTIGAAGPAQLRRLVGRVRDQHPDLALGLHLHNTYGMAMASAWEAITLGIRRFDASLGGTGGCPFAPGAAGNIATDDLVNMFHGAGIASGIDPAGLTRVRDQLRVLLGRRLDSALSAVPARPAELPASARASVRASVGAATG
jgi:hydroxymethylglutaryl-CoA lyase